MTSQWRVRAVSADGVERIARAFSLPEPLARVLVARIGDDTAAIADWLKPELSSLQDPVCVPGLAAASERIARAVRSDEPIVVFGDYDADGMTAAALLVDFLEASRANVRAVIPERSQGYGLSVAAVAEARAREAALIVTVDNGISAVDAVREARSHGIDVIITDHHAPPDQLPPANEIVHPHLTDAVHSWRDASGAGVALALAIGVRRVLRDAGWYQDAQPSLGSATMLAAIGTIADVVPLRGANRIIVAEGLKRLAATRHPVLSRIVHRLAEQHNIRRVDSELVAFRVAPMLNATGRLGRAELGYRALRCRDEREAPRFVDALFEANVHRKRIEQQVMQSVEQGLPDGPLPPAIVAAHPDWEHGVLGIAAGRIAESRQRPTILFQIQGELAKGSGRSFGGLDLLAAIRTTDDLCEKLGGHREAAGLTLPVAHLAELRRRVCAALASQQPEAQVDFADAVLPLREVTGELIEQLERLAPFGEGNPRPVFLSDPARIQQVRMLRGGHLQCAFTAGEAPVRAIGFRFRGAVPQRGEICEALFSPTRDDFRGGDAIQLRLHGLRPSLEGGRKL